MVSNLIFLITLTKLFPNAGSSVMVVYHKNVFYGSSIKDDRNCGVRGSSRNGRMRTLGEGASKSGRPHVDQNLSI